MSQAVSGILTDVGTNELEVVEFVVDDRPYAINVAKVREIIRLEKPMAVPESHPCVMGVFRNREDIVPLVDLGKWLGCGPPADESKAKIIVTEFNLMKVGFLVHGVKRIHRVSWADLESPGEESILDSRSAVGFLRLGRDSAEGERIVFLLDFEHMVAEIRPAEGEESKQYAAEEKVQRADRVVMVAEDSHLIRKMLRQKLEAGGYVVVVVHDGQEAWDKLNSGVKVDLVVSDIEMPRMDGHHLTHRIKQDSRFKGLPVVLYSSMISEEIRRKGNLLGADAQICKPDLVNLVETVDEFIFDEVASASQ